MNLKIQLVHGVDSKLYRDAETCGQRISCHAILTRHPCRMITHTNRCTSCAGTTLQGSTCRISREHGHPTVESVCNSNPCMQQSKSNPINQLSYIRSHCWNCVCNSTKSLYLNQATNIAEFLYIFRTMLFITYQQT